MSGAPPIQRMRESAISDGSICRDGERSSYRLQLGPSNILELSVERASARYAIGFHPFHGAGGDGLQLATYARLSLDAAGVYMRAFGAPAPWPAESRP